MIQRGLGWFAAAAGLVASLVIIENIYQMYWLSQSSQPSAQMSLTLLLQLYPVLFGMRLMVLTLGTAGLTVAVFWYYRKKKRTSELLVPAYVALLFVLVGEIVGRFLFYATHVRLGI